MMGERGSVLAMSFRRDGNGASPFTNDMSCSSEDSLAFRPISGLDPPKYLPDAVFEMFQALPPPQLIATGTDP